MITHLQYGDSGLDVEIPAVDLELVTPRFIQGLDDEAAAFRSAVRKPIGARPLRDLIDAADRVAVIISDNTRPLPSERLLRWLFQELSHVRADAFTIIIGTGSHRANTPEEIEAMVGEEIASQYRILNHNAYDPGTLARAGETPDGRPVFLNAEYVRADKRIVMGFIEPHFMAGFSGGYKGVFPAIADIDSIMHYHRASVIGDPRSTWGVLEDNPTQEQIRANGSLFPVTFCINVALNRDHQITRFFCGDVLAAHGQGCIFVKETSMVACERAYPVVVTTNGGYPLDQNLYQAVKGMSAAVQIVQDSGLIVAAARCNDGFPSHGNFRKLLFEHSSVHALLDTILAPGFSMYDQWEAQILAMIRLKAEVALYSEIPPEEVRRAHLEPVSDITSTIARELKKLGSDAAVAVLPEGPMTIPYVECRGGQAS